MSHDGTEHGPITVRPGDPWWDWAPAWADAGGWIAVARGGPEGAVYYARWVSEEEIEFAPREETP